jgi:regulation of enolase protein 1 (concanavalin A-like superfamily)
MRFELSRDMRTGGVDSDYIGLVANIEGLRAVSIVLTSETNQQKARRLDSDGCVFSENYGNLYLPTEVWLRISRTGSDFFTYYSYDRIKWYEITVPSPQTYSGLVTIHFGAKHRTGGNQFESRYQFWTLWPDGPSWLESGAYLPHLIESDDFDDNDLNERWFKRHGTYFRPTPFFAEGCIWEADQVLKVQTSPEQFHGPYNEFNGTWAWQDVKGFFNLTVKVMVNPALIVDEVEMGIIARELPAEGEPSCRVIYTKEGGVFYFKRVDTAADGSESETSIGAGTLSEFWLGLRWYKDGFTASYSLNGVNWDPIAAPAVPITPTNWLQVGCAAKGWVSPGFVTTTTTTTTTSTTTTTI